MTVDLSLLCLRLLNSFETTFTRTLGEHRYETFSFTPIEVIALVIKLESIRRLKYEKDTYTMG